MLCCGMAEIVGMSSGANHEKFRQYLAEVEQDAKNYGITIAIISINKDQKGRHRWILEAGYTPIFDWLRNLNTGHDIKAFYKRLSKTSDKVRDHAKYPDNGELEIGDDW